jgi:Fe-S cluster biosynthesis and repair protein YggX
MAKGDKQDVAKAKSAAAKARKTQQVRVNETRTKMASPKASRKLESKSAKTFNKGSKADIKAGSPIREKGTTKDWETRSGRMTNNPKLSAMDSRTTVMKNGSPTVKGGSSSVSARKPSVPNKVKTQGAKMLKGGLNYSGRKGN